MWACSWLHCLTMCFGCGLQFNVIGLTGLVSGIFQAQAESSKSDPFEYLDIHRSDGYPSFHQPIKSKHWKKRTDSLVTACDNNNHTPLPVNTTEANRDCRRRQSRDWFRSGRIRLTAETCNGDCRIQSNLTAVRSGRAWQLVLRVSPKGSERENV